MKYDWRIYHSVKAWYEENEEKVPTDEEIDKMSKYDILDIFLEWEGIIGYTTAIGSLIPDLFDKQD